MKKYIYLALLAFSIIFTSQPSLAQAQSKRDAKKAESTVSESSGTSATAAMGFGLASASEFTGAGSSLTGILELNEKSTAQAFFSLPSTKPFQFTLGGIFKQTLAESQGAGLHVGGGLSLGVLQGSGTPTAAQIVAGATGNTTGFALGITAIGGIHFPISSSQKVMVHLDGGPIFNLVDGQTAFGISALSSLLGISVVYML